MDTLRETKKCTRCKKTVSIDLFINEKKRELKTCKICRDKSKKYRKPKERKEKKEKIRKYNNRNNAKFPKKYLNKYFNMEFTDKECWEMEYFINNTICGCSWDFKIFVDFHQFIHFFNIKPQMWINWKKEYDRWENIRKLENLNFKYQKWAVVEEYKEYKGKMIYRWAYFQDGSECSKWIYYGDNQEQWEKEEEENEKEHEKEKEKEQQNDKCIMCGRNDWSCKCAVPRSPINSDGETWY